MGNTFVDWQVRLSDLTEQRVFLIPHNHYKIILGPLKKINEFIIHENSLYSLWYYKHKVTQTFSKAKPQTRNVFLNSTNPCISMYQDSMFSKKLDRWDLTCEYSNPEIFYIFPVLKSKNPYR